MESKRKSFHLFLSNSVSFVSHRKMHRKENQSSPRGKSGNQIGDRNSGNSDVCQIRNMWNIEMFARMAVLAESWSNRKYTAVDLKSMWTRASTLTRVPFVVPTWRYIEVCVAVEATTMCASIRPLSDSIFKILTFESTFNCESVLFYYFLMRIRFIFPCDSEVCCQRNDLFPFHATNHCLCYETHTNWFCVRRVLAREATFWPSPTEKLIWI